MKTVRSKEFKPYSPDTGLTYSVTSTSIKLLKSTFNSYMYILLRKLSNFIP